MSAWYDPLPLSLQPLAQTLLQQLMASGLSQAAAQDKILAPANRAWLIEQGQPSHPFSVLEDAAAQRCPAELLTREAAERSARSVS